MELDPDYYGNISQLKAACEKGIPSLAACNTLKIKGNVSFGKNVVFQGDVSIKTEGNILLEDIEIGNGSHS